MSHIIKPENVFFDIDAKDADEALRFFAKKACELGVSDDEQDVLKAFRARESEGSTGMAYGCAIPHAQSDSIKHSCIMIGRFAGPIEWSTMDGSAVKVAIAILTADVSTMHLSLLSKVAAKLMDPKFVEMIQTSDDAQGIADEIAAVIHDED